MTPLQHTIPRNRPLLVVLVSSMCPVSAASRNKYTNRTQHHRNVEFRSVGSEIQGNPLSEARRDIESASDGSVF
ncbi:hypothetical protein EDC01DRAFT_678699 [Geopyxis carbonaria]|nr:hypothetical protein EDC01DRAFT_678699 [Geopyxis carbonaria]